VRKNEADFKLNKLENIISDDLKMAKAISEYPKIMERPIAVLGSKAVIGRPPEKILALLTNRDKNESI
jgi:arsenate reductase